MRNRLLLLALVAPGCGPGEKSSSTTGSGSTEVTSTTGVSGGTVDVTGTSAGSTGAPTTSAGTTGLLPDGNCRVQADCLNFADCEPPGAVQCGGDTGCTLGGTECSDDPACGGTPESPQICVQDPCCALNRCQPGCVVDGDCGPAQRCGPDARCGPASCDPQTPCPANFSCTANSCAPTPCSGDAECDDYCVLGLCRAALGTCVAPAAALPTTTSP